MKTVLCFCIMISARGDSELTEVNDECDAVKVKVKGRDKLSDLNMCIGNLTDTVTISTEPQQEENKDAQTPINHGEQDETTIECTCKFDLMKVFVRYAAYNYETKTRVLGHVYSITRALFNLEHTREKIHTSSYLTVNLMHVSCY